MSCSSFDQLVDFVEGKLNSETKGAVSDHLSSGCQRCLQDVQWIQKILFLMQTDNSEESPSWAIDQLLGYFDKVVEERTSVKNKKTLTALLVFDSMQQAEFVGIRNLRAAAKQLLYQTEAYDIDIRFNPTESPQFENIIGQVLPREENQQEATGARICVCASGEEIRSALTNKLGVFTIQKLPQGRYDFKIMLPEAEITIAGITTSKFPN